MKRVVVMFLALAALLIVSARYLRMNKMFIEEISIKDSLIGSFGMEQNRLNYLQSSISIGHRYGNIILENQIVTDTLNITDNLTRIVADGPILVLRIKEGQCQSCVIFSMLKLETFFRESPLNIVVLANYHDLNSLKIANRVMNRNKTPFYNVRDFGVLDELNAPYFFILEKDLSITNVFVPEKAFPDVTNQYFDAIKYNFDVRN